MSLKVAAYCRVSTDKDTQQNSLDSQRKFFHEYIKRKHDWELVEVYYDEGVSGTSTKHREGFNRMIDDVGAGRINLIITKEVSRFARNTVDTLSYTRSLKEKGVGVLFINDNINTLDPDGELRLTIMASIAQEESRKTSERVRWGQKRRMEQGVVFGRDLLGYDVRDGKLYINPEGAEIVKLIFHKYVNENKGTHIIARELKEAGIKPMRVKDWSNTVILRVLRNEKYIGDLCQKKTYTPDYLNHNKKYNRGAEEKVYIKNHHEPVIEQSIWDKAQEILAQRTLTDERKSRHSCRYWCSGKLICGECGGKFVSRTKKHADSTVYKAWRCSESALHGSTKINKNGEEVGCDNVSVNEQVILQATMYVLKLLKLNKSELISEMTAEIKAVTDNLSTTDITVYEDILRKINDKKHILLDRYLEGIVSSEDYRRQNDIYDEEAAEVQKKIDTQKNIQLEIELQANRIEKTIEHVKEYLDFKTANENICGELLEKITVHKNKILDVKLKFVPSVRLKYKASGKGKNYKVEFDTNLLSFC